MNELLDNIGKRLPYDESESYLDDLIDRVTEHAIMQQNLAKRKRRWSMMVVSVAASAALIIGITLLHKQPTSNASVTLTGKGPIDEFLNSLSDEEAAQLPYYEIEEIPEY